MAERLLVVIALVAWAIGPVSRYPRRARRGQWWSLAIQQWAELRQYMCEAYQQRRCAEAVPLDQQANDLARRALGPKDRNTLISLDNLALLYGHQGR